MFLGNFDILGLRLTICDYQFILKELKTYINCGDNFLLTPLASQTFVLAYYNKKLRYILNNFNYLVSDSFWVRKSVNFLYNLGAKGRIRGSNLMLNICDLAQKESFKIFLYGTTQNTLDALETRLKILYPKLLLVGSSPSIFKKLNLMEKKELIKLVERSKADILLIALGSPSQEVFSHEILYGKPNINRPIAVIPVGAAFDFISGIKPQAPEWMQEKGLEWLFRFIHEPRRLWKRYLVYGSIYMILSLRQKIFLFFNSLSAEYIKQ